MPSCCRWLLICKAILKKVSSGFHALSPIPAGCFLQQALKQSGRLLLIAAVSRLFQFG